MKEILGLIQNGKYNAALDVLSGNKSIEPTEKNILLARIYREQGDYHKAEEIIISTLNSERFEVWFEYAYVLWRLNKHENAIKALEQPFMQSIDDPPKNASLLHLKGNILFSLGNYVDSLNTHLIAVEIFKNEGDLLKTALLYNNIGYTYSSLGEIKNSIKMLELSLKMNDGRHLQDMARTYANLGIAYRAKEDLFESKQYLEKAAKLQEELGNSSELSYTLFELLKLYVDLGEMDMSDDLLSQIEDIDEEMDNEMIHVRYLLGKAILYNEMKRFEYKFKAKQLFTEVIEDFDVFDSYTILAQVYLAEILLEELYLYNNAETLDELSKTISSLKYIGEQQNSHIIITNYHIINSRFQLIQNNLTTAKDEILKAKTIAEDNGILKLAIKCSIIYDNLLETIPQWEEREPGIEERIEISSIIPLLKGIQRNQFLVTDGTEENPVMLLILDDAGIPRFKFEFDTPERLNDNLIGSFLSAVNSFYEDVFDPQNNVETIKSKDYTIQILEHKTMLFVYVFKGEASIAKQKLQLFYHQILQSDFFQTLEKYWKDGYIDVIEIPDDIITLIYRIF
ncbi:MAG: tetratricopeptide repeat protein [Candidatus Heimdallarchaeota archaeon]|nr:tetratricopeptide repeat protein [Candidatus Heimdallarchaeota archaeon]